MCCCDTPTVNGQKGYKWQPDDAPCIRKVNPPDIRDGDALIFDEPGRCGGLDAHCHHFRVVRRHGCVLLLVRHGGGDEEVALRTASAFAETLSALDTHARYWLLHTIYYAHHYGRREAAEETARSWQQAAAEKRIRTRKVRGTNNVEVWIGSAAVGI